MAYKKALDKGQSFPQELQVGPRSCWYLLKQFIRKLTEQFWFGLIEKVFVRRIFKKFGVCYVRFRRDIFIQQRYLSIL